MNTISLNEQVIAEKIYLIRGKNVLLDADLSALYDVENKHLKRQVRRNIDRFPDDFMFELTADEVSRCQIGSLKQGGNVKYAPMVFIEHGVAMLSSVLSSARAIHINIQIIRIFTKMRQLIQDHTDLWLEIEKVKGKLDNQDKNMEIVFRYFDELLDAKPVAQRRKRIGFKSDEL